VKKQIPFVIALAFILAGVGMMPFGTAIKYNSFGDADAIGSEEDANARAHYEWMMLHDPASGMIPAHIRERELAFAATLPSDWHVPGALSKTTSLNFSQRGPWNVGGRTRALAIDVSNENVLIAGSCSGGMWRSTDQGQSWTPTTSNVQYKSVSCVTQDIRVGHQNVWYYGSGEAFGASASATGAYYLGNGIYKSIDSGKTWNVLAATTTSHFTSLDSWADLVWNIQTNAADTVNDAVYAAAYGGIYKSLNGGSSWSLVLGSFGGTDCYFTDMAITPGGVIYATLSSDGGAKGIYRSVDGVSFTNIMPLNFPASYNRIKIGICPEDETQVYFLGNTPGFGTPDTNYLGTVEWNSLWKYKYLSGSGKDTGGYWRNLSGNLPMTGGFFDKYTCQGSYDIVVKVKPNDSNTVFIGGTNLYRSTSGFKDSLNTAFIGGYQPGASLPVVVSYTNHHPDQHELVFFPSNANKMLSGNDGGIFLCGDNTASTVSWTPLNHGYMTSMFYSCAIDHAVTNDIVIGGAQDNGSWYTNTSNLSSPWVSPRGGDGSFCAIANNAAAYYFSIQNGKTMRAKLNAAGGVDSFARIDPIGGAGYLFVNPFVLDPNNNDIMYMAGGKYLWRNNNLSGIPYAGNWDSISTNWTMFPDSIPVGGSVISALAISTVPANRLYMGTTTHKLYKIDNANVGTPTPVDITSISIAAQFPSANISSIAVDPTNADHVMVAFSNYGIYSIFYSADGGVTWTKEGGNLEQNSAGTGDGPSVRWVNIIPVSDGYVYLAGTSVGLFACTHLNGLNTVWVQQGANTLGNDIVDMMDYRATDGLLVVATHSGGIFSSHINDTIDVAQVPHIANAAANIQVQCYPNPFSNAAQISFSLPEASAICLSVYDALGRQVMLIENKALPAGEHSYPIQGKDLNSGMYFINLRSGQYNVSKQVLLLK